MECFKTGQVAVLAGVTVGRGGAAAEEGWHIDILLSLCTLCQSLNFFFSHMGGSITI